MLYCKSNTSLENIWIDNGINPCFFETVTMNICGGLMILFGSVQWGMYSNGIAVPVASRPKSLAFGLQLIVSIFIPFLFVLRFCLQSTVLGDHHKIAGYMILSMAYGVIAWPLSAVLILLERTKRVSMNDVKYGHGFLLLLFWSSTFLTENLAIVSYSSSLWWFQLKSTSDILEFSLYFLRYVCTGYLFFVGFFAPGIPKEQPFQRLENNRNVNSSTASTWNNFYKKLKVLVPFMWPRKNFLLQLVVFICVILLILGRITNVITPIYYKLIVNKLSSEDHNERFCWDLILVYVAIKFFQGFGGTGGMGLLNNLRSLLWVSVQQYTTRELQVQLFSHLHSLSLRWHLSRKTGEVIRVMDRGTNSVNQLLSYIVFSILPTIFDIIIAIVFFSTAFNLWFGLIVFVTMVLYLISTIAVTEWRTKFRRSMNLADNNLRFMSLDSLINYETVKFYAGEEFEIKRYSQYIRDYQSEEWKSVATLSLLNMVQNVLINVGFLVGALLCASLVHKGTLTVGDYVLFSTYIVQLYVPLNWFGTYYRVIQQSFIDAENMFELLDEKQEVMNAIDAEPLVLPQGRIEFDKVCFQYLPEKEILRQISFTVEPGETVAIVGPTGAGKSTIMRLIFRFFDVTSGRILIDNKDIRRYTQESLRQAIGVVPQDTILFNDNIMYNIRYGKILSTDDEVKMAARNAEIHDSIIGFPEQYKTVVGERGLKLSGGEKQRVAIARTILKGPSFILLDEATSALDTRTERNIQNALLTICSNRTTLIVAHRLSTVIHADAILVLKDGEIAERGTHEQLLSMDGLYADMWNQQLQSMKNNGDSNVIPASNHLGPD